MSSILTCSCCASTPALENTVTEVRIRCTVCGLQVKRHHSYRDPDDIAMRAAIAAWNKRLPITTIGALVDLVKQQIEGAERAMERIKQ